MLPYPIVMVVAIITRYYSALPPAKELATDLYISHSYVRECNFASVDRLGMFNLTNTGVFCTPRNVR
jgi:hypothetical protein